MRDQNGEGSRDGQRAVGVPGRIDLSAAGLRFDDELLGPLSVPVLTERLGVPRIERRNPPIDDREHPRSVWGDRPHDGV